MKYTTRILTLILTLLPMLAAAQTQTGTKIVAQVPFDFVVGSKIVPAGEFIVQRGDPGALTGAFTLALRNQRAKIGLMANPIRTELKKPAATNVLVFHKYGNRYFLWEVKVEGSQTAYRLPESRAEAELRAQNIHATEEILLALK
jgi:hypothetical protein